jgi:acetyl-CoA carboxylase biotin carboxyl carrier protein
MNINDKKYVDLIREVAKVMDENNLTSVHIHEQTSQTEHISFSLQKNGEIPVRQFVREFTQTEPAEPKPAPKPSSGEEIKSPMVGVFYSSPSPDADPFVRIGDTVKKGDVLCILEAMKLLNEIQAETDGKIVDICVKNEDVVEFGTVLFRIEAAK